MQLARQTNQFFRESKIRPLVYKKTPKLPDFWSNSVPIRVARLKTIAKMAWMSRTKLWSGTRLHPFRIRLKRIKRSLAAQFKFHQFGSYKYTSKVYFIRMYPLGLSNIPPKQALSGQVLQMRPNAPKRSTAETLI
jgi:hypothetical protein